MTLFIRKLADGQTLQWNSKENWGTAFATYWGKTNANGHVDYEVELESGTVTRVTPELRNGWVKEGTTDVYYVNDKMVGYFEPSLVNKYTNSYFVYLDSPCTSFFACETDTTHLKLIIERFAK